VTGRPVQRYVTQGDAEDASSRAGSTPGYLTAPAIEKLLAGIDLERHPGGAPAGASAMATDAAAVLRGWTMADATFRNGSEPSGLALLGGEAGESASSYPFAQVYLAAAEPGSHSARRLLSNVLC
jgi:hypothetical protein